MAKKNVCDAPGCRNEATHSFPEEIRTNSGLRDLCRGHMEAFWEGEDAEDD